LKLDPLQKVQRNIEGYCVEWLSVCTTGNSESHCALGCSVSWLPTHA